MRRLLCRLAVWSLFVLPVLFVAHVATGQTTTVRFEIDMSEPIRAGWFNPDVHEVGIRGGRVPLSWDHTTLAEPAGDGLYTATVVFALNRPDPELVPHKFKVEGLPGQNGGWEDGRNRTFSLGGRIVDVKRAYNAPPDDIEPTFTGTIERHSGFSYGDFEGRQVFVYLPPGYAEDTERRYPVFYMHDGQNIFDASAAGSEWSMDETAQRMIEAGDIEPIIIVGVSNSPRRTYEYTPTVYTSQNRLPRTVPYEDTGHPLDAFTGLYRFGQADTLEVARAGEALTIQHLRDDPEPRPMVAQADVFLIPSLDRSATFLRDEAGTVTGMKVKGEARGGGGDAYGRMLVEQIKPFIDRTYRTNPAPEVTGLGGSSLGGLITMHLGLTYSDVFQRLWVASPSVWWDQQEIAVRTENLDERLPLRIFLDMGTGEGGVMVNGSRRLHAALLGAGWADEQTVIYMEEPEAMHTESAWAGRADEALLFLYPGL